MGKLRFERCPRCGPSWFEDHPAGWRCTDCSLCVERFQQSLARYNRGASQS